MESVRWIGEAAGLRRRTITPVGPRVKDGPILLCSTKTAIAASRMPGRASSAQSFDWILRYAQRHGLQP